MTDEELIKKYQKYKQKRIMVIMMLIFIGIIAILGFFLMSKDKQPSEPEKPSEEVKIDTNPPILELSKEEDSIIVGDTIDYPSYIKTATDDIDGDLLDSVKYNKINTKEEGDFDIVYYVFDSSNNLTQQTLKITINPKPEPEVIEEPEEQPKKEENKDNSSQQQSNNNSNTNNSTKEQQKQEPTVKYFMFTDGYTMTNVVEECAKELKGSGRPGTCEPITDDNGIYLGMKLILK